MKKQLVQLDEKKVLKLKGLKMTGFTTNTATQ